MSRRLILASANAAKLREISMILEGTSWDVVPQQVHGVDPTAEPHLTFVENALAKARHAAARTGLPALADDSGLCVDALQGAPGLYSARYAGAQGDAEANIDKLLLELRDVPDDQRRAHFHCVLVMLRHAEDPQPLIVEGTWRGRILHERRGTGGHGYDPVFFDPVQGQSASEMPLALKNRISHRGLALALLKTRLAEDWRAADRPAP